MGLETYRDDIDMLGVSLAKIGWGQPLYKPRGHVYSDYAEQ